MHNSSRERIQRVWDVSDKYIDDENNLYCGFGPELDVYWGFCNHLSQLPRYNDLEPDPDIENVSNARILSLYMVKQQDFARMRYYLEPPPLNAEPGRARSWVYSILNISGATNMAFFVNFARSTRVSRPAACGSVRKILLDYVYFHCPDECKFHGQDVRLFVDWFSSSKSLTLSDPAALDDENVFELWKQITMNGFAHAKKITVRLSEPKMLAFCVLIPQMIMNSPKCTKFKFECADAPWGPSSIVMAVYMAQCLLSRSTLREISLPVWILSALQTETRETAADRRLSIDRSLHRLAITNVGEMNDDYIHHKSIVDRQRGLRITAASTDLSPFECVEIKTNRADISSDIISADPMCQFPNVIVLTPLTWEADDESQHAQLCQRFSECMEDILLTACPVNHVKIAVRFPNYCCVILKWTGPSAIERFPWAPVLN